MRARRGEFAGGFARGLLSVLLVAELLGCAQDEPAEERPTEARVDEARADEAPASGEPASQPTAPSAQAQRDGYAASVPEQEPDGRARYGRALAEGTPEVGLSKLLADAKPYDGKTIRTSGTVARVCQAMGCWMELRGDGEGAATLRAPMAGHAFFLPQDAVGKPATIEGKVTIQPLTEAQKAHYRAEGMEATDVAVSVDAEAVVVGGS